MLFVWDDAKNEPNRRKHRVGFAVAKLVVDDRLHVRRLDRIENGESRWHAVGMAGVVVLPLVAHTWHEADDGNEHVRIISARRATELERKIHEQGA